MQTELQHLCSQLATRTVMYSALTRKHSEYTNTTHTQCSSLEQECITYKAQLAQLKQQFEAVVSEKTECMFQLRELKQVPYE